MYVGLGVIDVHMYMYSVLMPPSSKDVIFLFQILCNRAIAYAKLGKDQVAKNDFLKAVESRVEPRHGVIQDLLLCWQVNHFLTEVIVIIKFRLFYLCYLSRVGETWPL